MKIGDNQRTTTLISISLSLDNALSLLPVIEYAESFTDLTFLLYNTSLSALEGDVVIYRMTLHNKPILNPYTSKGKDDGIRMESKTNHSNLNLGTNNGTIKTTSSSSSLPRQPKTTMSTHDIDASTSFSQVFAHVEHGPLSKDHHDHISNNSTTANAPKHTHMNTTTMTLPTVLQPHVLLVSKKQRGNPILQYVRNVPFAYTDIVPDYILGSNRCALFLSLKYHNLYPNYIHGRIAELKTDYDLRILLCLVDVDDNASLLLFLNKLCCINHMTLVLAWSQEEAARYLETIKTFEHKDASLIQKKKEVTFHDQVAVSLACVRSVTKTDASQLLSSFTNMRKILNADMEELRLIPGIGDKKVKRLYDAFHKPFSIRMAKKRKLEQERLNNQEGRKEEESMDTSTEMIRIPDKETTDSIM